MPQPSSMKELAKSMISFSLALGFAGARGMVSALHREQREKFLGESEEWLRESTLAAVDTLDRGWRETFRFGDNLQRRMIDAMAARPAMHRRPNTPRERSASYEYPDDAARGR